MHLWISFRVIRLRDLRWTCPALPAIRLRRERSRVYQNPGGWLCNAFLTLSTMSEKTVLSSSTEPDALVGAFNMSIVDVDLTVA